MLHSHEPTERVDICSDLTAAEQETVEAAVADLAGAPRREHLEEAAARSGVAFNAALRRIGSVDRKDPICEIVARRLIEVQNSGVTNAVAHCEITTREIGLPNESGKAASRRRRSAVAAGRNDQYRTGRRSAAGRAAGPQRGKLAALRIPSVLRLIGLLRTLCASDDQLVELAGAVAVAWPRQQ